MENFSLCTDRSFYSCESNVAGACSKGMLIDVYFSCVYGIYFHLLVKCTDGFSDIVRIRSWSVKLLLAELNAVRRFEWFAIQNNEWSHSLSNWSSSKLFRLMLCDL